MAWDQRQRERIAKIIESRPVQMLNGVNVVVLSAKHRDALVRELRADPVVDEFDLSRYGGMRIDLDTIQRLEIVERPRGFWARLKWVIKGE
jgi:hypothetical protein